MAIDKIESKKYEFTKEAVLQLGIAAALAVSSILLGWFAFSNWKFKSSLVAGYREYAGNNLGTAKRELEDAISWKPEHVGAREVLAKILCDAGGSELSAAEAQYKRIRELGGDSPAVKVGMGVALLKRAELASAAKDVQDLVNRAAVEFQAAGGVPEGNIGLGHCLLLAGQKTGNVKLVADARSKFESVRKGMESKASAAFISRDGLIDYYSGLGRSYATDNPKDLEVSREAFLSCTQLARRWEVPRSNVMAVEARRWALWKGTAAEITSQVEEVNFRRKQWGTYWRESRDTNLIEAHKGPWTALSISFAQALGRAGNLQAAGLIFNELRSMKYLEDLSDASFAEARFRCDAAVREGQKASDQDGYVRDALSPLDTVLKKFLSSPADDAAKDRRALALNAQGVMRFMQGTSGYKAAQDSLTEALKLRPDDYVFNRNLLVVLKRSKAPPAMLQPVLEKTKAGATGEFAADFEKVQKVLEEK